MEILLLYPAIGLIWFPWFWRNEKRYLKREQRFNAGQTLLAIIIVWPVALWLSPKDWKQGAQELEAEKERDFEQLEKRVRAEARLRHRSQIAEFDKELGIEKHWERAHPEAAREYERMGRGRYLTRMREAQERSARMTEVWDVEPDYRIRDLPKYSKGGRFSL